MKVCAANHYGRTKLARRRLLRHLDGMARITLVNPNTSTATTDLMVAIARAQAPGWLEINGMTAHTGAALITNEASLALAADAVVALVPELSGDGVIVAAFGDPGADRLRARLRIPVVGIGEASIRAAAAHGRRFAIVTTTAELVVGIERRVTALGCAHSFAGVRVTAREPVALTADPRALEAALFALVELSVRDDGAEAIVIGGGPLSAAARAIAGRTSAAIIEPVPAAVAWMARALATPG